MKNEKGQSLIELLICIALIALTLPILISAVATTRSSKAQESQKILAVSLLREEKEAVRVVRESGWSNISNGQFYPQTSGTSWVLTPGEETNNGVTRSIVIESVNRDTTGSIVSTGGALDPSTKKITYSASWTEPYSDAITTTEYLTRYLGNTTLVHTTQTDFTSGVSNNTVISNTSGGEITLSPAVQNGTFNDTFDIPGNYTFDSTKIDVSNGKAQLKANNGGTTSGQTTNSAFLTGISPWTFKSFGDAVAQVNTWLATGGNTLGYDRLDFPSASNKIAGSYLEQPLVVTATNPTVTLSLNYKVFNYVASADALRVRVWVDSVSGGTPTNQVWQSTNITATSAWISTGNINISSAITTPGTYYVKAGVYLDYSTSNKGPYRVGLDNVAVSWTGNTVSYPSDSPTIQSVNSFSAGTISAFNSFSTAETPNGGSVWYQLSTNDGTTWQYFNGSQWVSATATQYNDAATINTNISSLPVTNNKIMVKSFLIGNGTQQVQLDTITIGYTGSGSATGSGTFESATLDAGAQVGFNRLLWNGTGTTNTTTQFQLSTNNDNSTWNYVGPDGTSATYFNGGAGAVPYGLIAGRYARYKIFFTSNNVDIPMVSDVTINYSP